jgi:hypothetical protein
VGFKHPLTSSSLDTGGAGPRVVIVDGGGLAGGGAVLLYPDQTSDPGILEGGFDAVGPFVQLSSPPDAIEGIRNQLVMGDGRSATRRGIELKATEDINLTTGLAGGASNVYANGRPLLQPARAWNFPRGGSATDTWVGGVASLIGPGTLTGAPAGDYLVTLQLVLSASAAAATNVYLLVNNADVLVGPRIDLSTVPDAKTLTYTIEGHPGGTLIFEARVGVPAGVTGSIWKAGSRISVAYLGPR